jgi:CRP/FNR family cyclic AMP-dependent transcriptional regulator
VEELTMNNLELLALMHAHAFPRCWDQPTPADWADVLAGFPLFTGVSKRRLRKLVRTATLAAFAPGETIIFAGDRDNFLYVILDGKAKTIARRAGRALPVGEYFGEVALIDGRPRSATVVAMSHVQVMKLPSRSVLKLARQHPAITLTMLRDLATRLRQLEQRVPARPETTPLGLPGLLEPARSEPQ